MPFLAFTAFSGATAQCQQLELLVLPLQHQQGLHRERKESWELTGMGTKGDMSYFGAAAPKNQLLGCVIQTPRASTSWWGSALTKKLMEIFVESLWHESPWKKICP